MTNGRKEFVNNTPHILQITLLIRQWDDPDLLAGTANIVLEAHSRKIVSYGSDTGSIYLNGLTISWEVNGSICQQTQTVLNRGSSFDNLLNMTGRLSIDTISPLSITGNNL